MLIFRSDLPAHPVVQFAVNLSRMQGRFGWNRMVRLPSAKVPKRSSKKSKTFA
jgi:hypothetical protein